MSVAQTDVTQSEPCNAAHNALQGGMPEAFDPVAYINTPRWNKVSLGLERIQVLMEKLGNPQNELRFVHVAGTNGKGSICVFLSEILQAAGYTTGLFTSPYLEVFEERIRVNGQNIPYDDLLEITLAVRAAAAEVERECGEHPTEFELMTAVALCYYRKAACDIVVLEVGLGGRLDSTNCIPAPEVCVIARLGLDHTAILGNSLAEIAAEKAGIIKAGAAVVSYPQEDEAARVLKCSAQACGTSVRTANFDCLFTDAVTAEVNAEGEQILLRSFSYKGAPYQTQLLGVYQPGNAACAIEVSRALHERGWRITDEHIRAGIRAAVWLGRFELMPHAAGEPWVVVDGGHNPQGVEALCATLADVFPKKAPVVVLSVLADKDYASMAQSLVAVAKSFVVLAPPNQRALIPRELAQVLQEEAQRTGKADCLVQEAVSFDEAFRLARAQASAEDVIVFSGSLYSVALAKAAVRNYRA